MARIGRPTKYNPEVMLPLLHELADGDGCYREVLAYHLGIAESTLYDWLNPKSDRYAGDEFSEAVNAVVQAKYKWLMGQLDDQITGASEGAPSPLIFTLKNTVHWKDKYEHDVRETRQTFKVGGPKDDE